MKQSECRFAEFLLIILEKRRSKEKVLGVVNVYLLLILV